MQRARAMATRCFWPPGEVVDVRAREVREAHGLKVAQRDLLGLGLAHLAQRHGRERAVVEHVHVVEQVEALEDHADLLAQTVHVHVLGGEVGAVEPDVAGVGRLEQVDAAQKGRLARSGGTGLIVTT